MNLTNKINRKSLYDAVYRCRNDGYVLDSKSRIVYLNSDDFIYWKSTGMNPAAKFLQWNFDYQIILKNKQ